MSASSGETHQCVCCLQIDGVRDGVEVDPQSGLCLYCQPCPECGQMGTACTDDGANVICYGRAAS